MNDIWQNSKKISEIIGVIGVIGVIDGIDGIAFQTNILALNATVEAGLGIRNIVEQAQRVKELISEISVATAQQTDEGVASSETLKQQAARLISSVGQFILAPSSA